MSRYRYLLLLAWLPVALAQPNSFIVTDRGTRAALNSLRLLNDGSVVYSDAYGVYRATAQRTETLLTNPVQEAYCIPMFGRCFYWISAVYHLKPMAADSQGTIYIADPEKHLIERYDGGKKAFVTVAENAGAPTSLAAGDDGDLYFNDPGGCRVRRLSQER